MILIPTPPRTNSLTSERSTYSSRSSRNSSIVSEKASTFNRNNSILSKDSAISEDISEERKESGKWTELGKKYGNNGNNKVRGEATSGNKLIGDKISQLTRNGENETSGNGPKRPKDLAIAQKKLSTSTKSPSSKNFKELAEKWQTISVDSPTTPSSISSVSSSATLPRKASSKEKSGGSPSASSTSTVLSSSPSNTASTLPRRREESRQGGGGGEREDKSSDEAPWSPDPPTGHPMENPYYQVSLFTCFTIENEQNIYKISGPPTGHPMENPYSGAGLLLLSNFSPPLKFKMNIIYMKYLIVPCYVITTDGNQVNGEMEGREWSGFDMAGKCDIPDRKFSVPAYNEASVKLRDKRDTMPSRPSSLIESSEQKDLKIFEIGNLGDERRLLLNSNSISQSSSQADLLDSNSVTSDTPKSPLPSSSSREILDVFSNRNNRRAVSVNDIRRAFEKAEQSLSNSGTPKRLGLATPSSHNRMSSLDSTTSEESSIPTPHFHGSVSSLTSGHGGLKDHYGSITSLASSTSMISPQVILHQDACYGS